MRGWGSEQGQSNQYSYIYLCIHLSATFIMKDKNKKKRDNSKCELLARKTSSEENKKIGKGGGGRKLAESLIIEDVVLTSHCTYLLNGMHTLLHTS